MKLQVTHLAIKQGGVNKIMSSRILRTSCYQQEVVEPFGKRELSRTLCDDNCSLGDKKLLKGVDLSRMESEEYMCSPVSFAEFSLLCSDNSYSSLTTHFVIVLSFCFKRTQKK